MTTDQITGWTQLAAAAGTVVAPIVGAFVAFLRYRLKMAAMARGEPPDKLPDLAGPVPLLLIGLGPALLAYLFAQNPRLAVLVPNALGAESSTASAAPVGRDLCSKDSDCGSGCHCDKQRCSCTGKALPRERKPAAVSMAGTICADCLPLPWMQVAIQTAPGRPE